MPMRQWAILLKPKSMFKNDKLSYFYFVDFNIDLNQTYIEIYQS